MMKMRMVEKKMLIIIKFKRENLLKEKILWTLKEKKKRPTFDCYHFNFHFHFPLNVLFSHLHYRKTYFFIQKKISNSPIDDCFYFHILIHFKQLK